MAITWISSQSNNAFITLDNQGRIAISAGLRDIIGIPRKTPFALVFGYDAETGYLIAGKPELVKADAEPFKFDTRGYCKRAATVLKGADITIKAPPVRFYLIGDGEAAKQAHLPYPKGVYAFRMED
ncbi:hypothetical protein MM326_13755 [Alkalihalobacillus sp. LMS6]|jgi:glutamine synthetase|uniref:hypothetical protein n=1 Tax=Alkalihalobacillus sp. LMS6 TaxID=2924034 RepID=UPI0020D08750|nr:hypothetical protein [Alkalihalobacillus sp. LMS6]UTR05173.1 hypothetical protein MM326_13755 [Alkalihalobacillus sp. LMS6]